MGTLRHGAQRLLSSSDFWVAAALALFFLASLASPFIAAESVDVAVVYAGLVGGVLAACGIVATITVPDTFADLNHCQNVLVRDMGVAPLDAPIVLRAAGHKGESRASEINAEFLDLRSSFAVRLLLRMNTPAYEAGQFAVTLAWSAVHVIQPLGVASAPAVSWPLPVAVGVACTYAVAFDRFGAAILRLWVGTGWTHAAAPAEREPETMEAPTPKGGTKSDSHRHHVNAASPVHRRRSSARASTAAAVAKERFARRGTISVAVDACILFVTLAGGAMLLFPPRCDDGDGCGVSFRTAALTVHLIAGGLRPVRSVRLIEAVERVYFSGQGRANTSLLLPATTTAKFAARLKLHLLVSKVALLVVTIAGLVFATEFDTHAAATEGADGNGADGGDDDFNGGTSGWTYWQACYFAVATISTVGYGDFSPTNGLSRLVVMAAIAFGVGVFPAMVGDTYEAQRTAELCESTDLTAELAGAARPLQRLCRKVQGRRCLKTYVEKHFVRDFVQEGKGEGGKAEWVPRLVDRRNGRVRLDLETTKWPALRRILVALPFAAPPIPGVEKPIPIWNGTKDQLRAAVQVHRKSILSASESDSHAGGGGGDAKGLLLVSQRLAKVELMLTDMAKANAMATAASAASLAAITALLSSHSQQLGQRAPLVSPQPTAADEVASPGFWERADSSSDAALSQASTASLRPARGRAKSPLETELPSPSPGLMPGLAQWSAPAVQRPATMYMYRASDSEGHLSLQPDGACEVEMALRLGGADSLRGKGKGRGVGRGGGDRPEGGPPLRSRQAGGATPPKRPPPTPASQMASPMASPAAATATLRTGTPGRPRQSRPKPAAPEEPNPVEEEGPAPRRGSGVWARYEESDLDDIA